MKQQPIKPAQRITAICLLISLFLQSCYPNSTGQLKLLEPNKVTTHHANPTEKAGNPTSSDQQVAFISSAGNQSASKESITRSTAFSANKPSLVEQQETSSANPGLVDVAHQPNYVSLHEPTQSANTKWLNKPLNWRSYEGHTLQTIYIHQNQLRAQVADQASKQLIYNLPITIFPHTSLEKLAIYSPNQRRHYLHIQPASNRVVIAAGGLPGGGKEEKTVIKETKQEEEEPNLLSTAISKQHLKTLWHLGKDLKGENYRYVALTALTEQADQGDAQAAIHLIKKLSKIATIDQLKAQYSNILPASWRDKTADELQETMNDYYEKAVAHLQSLPSKDQSNEQTAYKLQLLRLQQHYYQLLTPDTPKREELLTAMKKELNQLALQKMPLSLSIQRAYLSYWVRTANQMNLIDNPHELRTYVEYVAEQIAEKAKDDYQFGTNKQESETLRQLAARYYRKLGDLSENLKNDNNIGKSDEWQHGYYSQARKLQDPVATYRLGLLYEKDGGLHENADKAHQAFEEAAQAGYALAEHRMALYHEQEGDHELAILCHERAAQQGHPVSLYVLYQKADQFADLNYTKNHYLEKAAQAGHREAQYSLGKYYWQLKQYEQTIPYLEKAASQGIYDAYAFLGQATAKGWGTSKDPQKALDYYIRAEKAGDNAMARYGKARLYEKGQGVAANPATALKLYMEAGKLGHYKAIYRAGRLHLMAQAENSHYQQAYAYLDQAAKHGIYPANLLLARMHEYGWGGQVDMEKAVEQYNQAASADNQHTYSRSQALYQLGWLHRLGKGTDQDEKAALNYFEKAAVLGQDKYVQLQKAYEALNNQWQVHQEASKNKVIQIEANLKPQLEETQHKLKQQEEALKKLQEEQQAHLEANKKIIAEKEEIYKKLQEESKNQLTQKEANLKKQLEDAQSRLQKQQEKFKKQLEEAQTRLQQQKTKQHEEQQAHLEANKKIIAEKEEDYKKLQEENRNQLIQKEDSLNKELEEAKTKLKQQENKLKETQQAHLEASKKIIAEKEEIYKKLQEESKNQLTQKEATLKKQLEDAQTKLQQQEVNFKKQQEEKNAQETVYAVYKDLVKNIMPNGESIINGLANNNNAFRPTNTTRFTEQDITLLVKHTKFKELTSIDFDSRSIDKEGLRILVNHLKLVPNLSEFIWTRKSEVDPADMQNLALALKGCKNLNKLKLHVQKIGDAGAQALATALKECKNLTELDLSINERSFRYISNAKAQALDVRALATALKECKNLTSLSLSSNKIDAQGVQILATTLKECKSLQNLDLSNNQIGDQGAQILATTLKECKNFKRLLLQDNQISKVGAKELGENLKGCNGIYIDLQFNEIRGEETIFWLEKKYPSIKWGFPRQEKSCSFHTEL